MKDSVFRLPFAGYHKIERVLPAVTNERQVLALGHVLESLSRIDVPLLIVGNASPEPLVP